MDFVQLRRIPEKAGAIVAAGVGTDEISDDAGVPDGVRQAIRQFAGVG
jgi:hypothetical protein